MTNLIILAFSAGLIILGCIVRLCALKARSTYEYSMLKDYSCGIGVFAFFAFIAGGNSSMTDFKKIMKDRDELLKDIRDKKWKVTQLNQKLSAELYDAIYKLNVLSKYKWIFLSNGGYFGKPVYIAIIEKDDENSLLNLFPTGEDDDYGYNREMEIIKGMARITAQPSSRNGKGHVTLILEWDTALQTIKELKLKVCGDYSKSIEERKKRIADNSNEIDILEQLNKLG